PLPGGGPLFLGAPAEEAERCRPLFSSLLLSLLRRATARARSLGGVLTPRLFSHSTRRPTSPAFRALPDTSRADPARASSSCFAITTSPRSKAATAPRRLGQSGTT